MQLTDAASQQILNDAVNEFARATNFPLAFGGFEANGITTVTAVSGNRGATLHGLQVESSRGLGGRAMSEHRPRFTTDYMSSRQFSHDYDAEIGAEGIVMLFAVPVLVEGHTRAVLYGGTRGETSPDSTFLRAAAGVASDLAREIHVQDEVARRLSTNAFGTPIASAYNTANTPANGAALEISPGTIPGSVLEELRDSHAELRRIVADTTDVALRDRLAALEQRLAGIGNVQPVQTEIRLTPREADVLTQAAIGSTNIEIGRALGLTESTVKSYLKTAMAKLEATTRHAAVVAARSYGMIP